MKHKQIMHIAVACAWSALGWALPSQAQDAGARPLKPLQCQTFDLGRKHLVTYFLPRDGHCRLTVFVADPMPGDDDVRPAFSSAASRFELSVEADGQAQVDTPEGKAVSFRCAPGGTMMSLRPIDRIAVWSPRQ